MRSLDSYFPTRSQYDIAANYIVECCTDLEKNKKIESAFFYGSYAINEHVAGFSDIDVFLALPTERIELELYSDLNTLSNEVARQFDINCNYQIRGGDVRVEPFIAWLLGEYNKPIIGEDPKIILHVDALEEDYLRYGASFAQRIVPKYISELRKVLLQMGPTRQTFKNVALPPSFRCKEIDYRIEKASLVIDRVLDIVMYGNLFWREFAYRRLSFVEMGVRNFEQIISEPEIIERCFELRLNWGKNELGDLEKLIRSAPLFVEEIDDWMRKR